MFFLRMSCGLIIIWCMVICDSCHALQLPESDFSRRAARFFSADANALICIENTSGLIEGMGERWLAPLYGAATKSGAIKQHSFPSFDRLCESLNVDGNWPGWLAADLKTTDVMREAEKLGPQAETAALASLFPGEAFVGIDGENSEFVVFGFHIGDTDPKIDWQKELRLWSELQGGKSDPWGHFDGIDVFRLPKEDILYFFRDQFLFGVYSKSSQQVQYLQDFLRRTASDY